jgi:hypothetical protein
VSKGEGGYMRASVLSIVESIVSLVMLTESHLGRGLPVAEVAA